MRKLKLFIALCLAIAAILFAGSCTCNNGDIGPWFGTWHLNEITVDGEPDEEYHGNIFWQFQNDVVCMLVRSDYHGQKFHWGKWKEEPGKLILDYNHPPKPEIADPSIYSPPAAVHLPAQIITLTIDRFDSGKLQCTYHAADGTTYRYFLSKQ